jgi:hypothetical protein
MQSSGYLVVERTVRVNNMRYVDEMYKIVTSRTQIRRPILRLSTGQLLISDLNAKLSPPSQ